MSDFPPDSPFTLGKIMEENIKLREALRPFAAVAKHDIGSDEVANDFFYPMTRHNRAERLRVGHFLKAFNTLGDDDAL